jgi:hypothetical protein
LGNEVLTEWAEKAQAEAGRQARQANPNLIDYGKKTSDLALDLRRYFRGRRVFAGRSAGPTRPPVLPAGRHCVARLFVAPAESLGRFRRG